MFVSINSENEAFAVESQLVLAYSCFTGGLLCNCVKISHIILCRLRVSLRAVWCTRCRSSPSLDCHFIPHVDCFVSVTCDWPCPLRDLLDESVTGGVDCGSFLQQEGSFGTGSQLWLDSKLAEWSGRNVNVIRFLFSPWLSAALGQRT